MNWSRLDDGARCRRRGETLGGLLVTSQRWSDAEALFSQYLDARSRPQAEVALVGLIRVRVARGQAEAAAGLIIQYEKRFAFGPRRNEVERLKKALSP